MLALGGALLAWTPAHAQWRAVNGDGACTQAILPSGDNPTMVGLTGNGGLMVMVTFASSAMPQLGPGANYQGLMRFDEGEAKSIAIVQRPDKETVMVAMMLPAEHLDIFARSRAIHVRLDGRRLTEVAPPGRDGAVAALRSCIAALPSGRNATTAAPARAAPRPLPQRRSTDDALAAAATAGDRAARGEPRTAPRQNAGPSGAYPQGDADTLLMMMRMNNRLMNNGGNMADPSMGAVMQGLEY
ncbi:MAG: hypothetical protein AB7E60_04530 [Sphingobium sp.]